jgi:hypothetical protein
MKSTIKGNLKVLDVKLKIGRAFIARGFRTRGYTPDYIKLFCTFYDNKDRCHYATIRVGTYTNTVGVVSHREQVTVTKPDLISAESKTYDVVDWYNDPRFTLPCTDVKLRVLLKAGDIVDLQGQFIEKTSCKGNQYFSVKRAKILTITPGAESEVAI